MKVIIFYGTDCNAQSAWIPYIYNELNSRNIECIIPNLPTPKNQTYKNWCKVVDKIKIDNNDIIIGWSTGAIFAVRYLFEKNLKVKKLILISGFNNYVGNIPAVDKINANFFMQNLSAAQNIAKNIVCIKSDKDPFISQNALTSFAVELNAKIVNIQNGGHFNNAAGYGKFSELLNEILKER